MLSSEEKRFAMDDARKRHEAVVQLIFQTDQQARALLALYVTLGLATASGFVDSLHPGSHTPQSLTWPLIAAACLFLGGAYACLRTMEMASINLPGREADFWTWANGPLVTFDNAFDAYMQNLHAKDDMNYALNVRTANAIKLARRFGLAAPIIALLVAACRAVAAI